MGYSCWCRFRRTKSCFNLTNLTAHQTHNSLGRYNTPTNSTLVWRGKSGFSRVFTPCSSNNLSGQSSRFNKQTYWFMPLKNSSLLLVSFILPSRNSTASTVPIGFKIRRSTHIFPNYCLLRRYQNGVLIRNAADAKNTGGIRLYYLLPRTDQRCDIHETLLRPDQPEAEAFQRFIGNAARRQSVFTLISIQRI